jgi:hypothetical protein
MILLQAELVDSYRAGLVPYQPRFAVSVLEMFGLDERFGPQAEVKRSVIGELDIHLGAVIARFMEREALNHFPRKLFAFHHGRF